MKRYQGLLFSWLMAVLLPAFVVIPALISPVEEHSYDAATFHVYRAVLFSAARDEGSFYPRWIQPINAGLGGPLFSFYSPLAYFAMDGLNELGIPHTMGWRILVAAAPILASTGIFALLLALTRRADCALAASAVFVYSFPFLRELFERGSPEGFSFALYPWVLWSLVRLIQRPSGLSLSFASILLAGVILLHNLSAFLLVPALGLVGLLLVRKHGRWALGAPLAVVGFAALLSAFFTITIATEWSLVHHENALANEYVHIAKNPVSTKAFFQLPEVYDKGLDNNFNGGPIGPFAALILLATIPAGVYLSSKRRYQEALLIAGFGTVGTLTAWLMTASSNWAWEVLPFVAYLQMRTRLLGLTILSIAVVAAFIVGVMSERWRTPLACAIASVAIFLALPVLYPELQYRYGTFAKSPSAADAQAFSLARNVPGFVAFNEFLPKWRTLPLPTEVVKQASGSVISTLPEGSRIIRETRNSDKVEVQIESPVAFDATVQMLYFPRWAGYIDGQPRSLKPIEGTGFIAVGEVPAGAHTIELRYEDSVFQSVALLAGGLAAAGLILIAVLWRSKHASIPAATYLQPRWWLALGLVFLVGGKTFWLDPQTTLLRRASTCAGVQGNATNAGVQFGDGLYLCAIDLPERNLEPGGTVSVTLYWETTKSIGEPVDSFVHLLGTQTNSRTNNPLWGQQNKQLPGLHPTTRWAPNKIYRDRYEFSVAPDAPGGEYKLEIGWWNPSTGKRLKPNTISAVDGLSVSDIDSLLVSGIKVR